MMHKKTKNRLLNNKRGVFGGIMSSVGSFLQGLLHTVPKSLLFIIFIFIILLVAQLLTFIFNIFGVYCTSGDVPVTIGFNPLKTAELIGEIPSADELNQNAIDPNGLQQTVGDCSMRTSGTYTMIYDDGTSINSSTPRYLYNGRGGCVDCTLVTIDFEKGITSAEQWCIDDATTKPENEKTTLAKWFCGAKYMGRCEPPPHYYWESTTGKYACQDSTCTGKTVGDYWDDTLQKNDARPLYADAYGEAIDTRHDKFVSIQCKDARPKLTVYGIDIFNFTYWMILMLLGIMMWALQKFL